MGESKSGTIVMRVRDPQPDPPPLAEHLPLVSARGPLCLKLSDLKLSDLKLGLAKDTVIKNQ